MKQRICRACGLPAVTFRGGVPDAGPACRSCVRLSSWKWESAVDEWRRILRAEREEAKKS